MVIRPIFHGELPSTPRGDDCALAAGCYHDAMDMLARAEAVRRQIDEAFAEVVMPPRKKVVEGHSPDEAHVLKHFGGKRREDLGPVRCGWTEDLLYMSRDAVRYYLPVFLTHLLHREQFNDFEVMTGVIGYLNLAADEAIGSPWPNLIRRHLSSQQQAALLAWVDFLRHHLNSYHLGESRPEQITRLNHIRKWLKAE
jgi:hypothetical protein